ncbi:MAG: putative HNH restriction endonuclease [Flavobacteriaceae bacterium]|jgi:predicted HNH restriction endonuclease
MKKHTLKIHEKFFKSLGNDKSKKILRVYGFDSPELFIKNIISELNKRYDFLNITEYSLLDTKEEGKYHQYNGYIKGDFIDYDLITISFTTIHGKEGNVFLSQQVMPMITSKLKEKDGKKFLLDDRIKKICILTTHKSDKFTPDSNEISDTGISNIQMSIKYINTIGFDVIDLIHIKNLNIHSKYNSVDELVDHANYLQSKNASNSQFKQITKKGDIYSAKFKSIPKGQDIKFFALKLYAVIILQKGQGVDISKALEQTSDITLRVMHGFTEFLKKTDLTPYNIFRVSVDDEEREVEIIEIIKTKDKLRREKDKKAGVPCYEQEPIFDYNKKGKMVFKTQRVFKKESFNVHGYKCACDDEKHLYFVSDSTKQLYVEGHHMIPMEFQEQYWTDKKRNLDCTINLIPLCPHCHRKIHKAVKGERIQIITNIFTKYQTQLKTVDNNLTLEKFAELYNVYIY